MQHYHSKALGIKTSFQFNLTFAFIFFCFITFAQTYTDNCPYVDWQHNYGGSEGDFAKSIRPTQDGGYILIGNTYSNNGDVNSAFSTDFASDIWVVKVDKMGNLEWEKRMGGSDNEFGWSVEPTLDGGYIVASSARSPDGDVGNTNGGADCWVIKLTASGNIEWEKTYGGIGDELSPYIIATLDGNFILVANLFPDGVDGLGGSDIWVLKISPSGNSIWEKTYGSAQNEEAKQLVATADGGYIIAGWQDISDSSLPIVVNNTEAWIIKTNSLGEVQWEKRYGYPEEDYANAISSTQDGGYIIVGQSEIDDGLGNITAGSWIFKLDGAGNLIWENRNAGSLFPSLEDVQETENGDYIAVGQIRSQTLTDFLVLIFDPYGTQLWQKTFGGNLQERAFSVIQTNDGGYLIAGHSYSNSSDVSGNQGKADFYAIKLADVKPLDLGQDTVLCEVLPLKLDATQDNVDYLWQDASTDAILIANNSGDYSVSVQKGGCVQRDSIRIDMIDPRWLNLGEDVQLCGGEEKELNASLPYPATYRWQNGSSDSVFIAQQAGNYQVTAFVEGCILQDNINIYWCESCFYLPNIFSPNFDGKNDLLEPIVLCDIENYHFVIFDRWGQLVFESYEIGEAWDGYFKNKKQPIGVYTYILEYDIRRLGIELREVIRGDLTLVR